MPLFASHNCNYICRVVNLYYITEEALVRHGQVRMSMHLKWRGSVGMMPRISFTFKGSLKWIVNAFKIFLTTLTYIHMYLAILNLFHRIFITNISTQRDLYPCPKPLHINAYDYVSVVYNLTYI